MHACFILPAILILPSAWAMTIEESKLLLDSTIASVGLNVLDNYRQLETLLAIVEATKNTTSELLTDLQVLKGRQAIAGAIAVAQVCMFITYILFCLGIYLVKHCKKRQEKVAKAEFALLEQQLAESRRRRRAAAAASNKQTPQ